MKSKLQKLVLVGGSLAASAGGALADGTDIATTLTSASTTAITAIATAMGTIIIAAMVIPVGKKTARAVISFLGFAK